MNAARRERAPFLTWGNAAAASCLLNQTEHAPDHGRTGGQQSSVKGRLLRKRSAGGAIDRETHPRSLVGSGVYESRVVPVARTVGSDLGSCGLVGLGRVAIAHSISGPERSHTSGSLALAPGSPALAAPLDRNRGSSSRSASAAPDPPFEVENLRAGLSPNRSKKSGVSSATWWQAAQST